MDEIRFVLKCFAFAVLLLMLTQIKSGDLTIENHIEAVLLNSKTATFVNKVAEGGVKVIKDGGHYAQASYLSWKHEGLTKSAEKE